MDQDVGAAGSTGRGEENIRVAGAHTIVENMRHGMSPKDACLDALKRVARNFDNDRARLEQFDLNFYALRKDGEYAGASLWNGVLRGGSSSRGSSPSTTAAPAAWRIAPGFSSASKAPGRSPARALLCIECNQRLTHGIR